MNKIIIIGMFSVLMVGCSGLETVKVAADHMVSKYCSTPELSRAALRKEVATVLEPNSVTVHCAPPVVHFDEFDNVVE
ncbi:hypothetical protein CL653_03690 [bacterium]|nr:hypothetical protein [bacterium]|tara:strand:+ start:974 stop:1207 length:234 start_codon:yes stop_codon:yes gene_type:complete